MPIHMKIFEKMTDPIIFPVTLNDAPMDLTGVTALALVKSGWDGKLSATVSSSNVSVYDTLNGLIKWAQTSGDLVALYGPYRVYFRATVSGGTLDLPRGDWFLIDVQDDML